MNLEKLCDEVITLSKSVGAFIKQEAATFSSEKIEYKGVNDMVSYVDKTAEEMIVTHLSKLLPEAGFIAEEGTSTKKGEVYNWIIDPLDGTTNFIHGIPTYAVSIALQKDAEIVLGVIYEVVRDECFYAWENSGAYLNGKQISVSKTTALKDSLVATGFPYYDFDKQEAYMEVFKDMMRSCHGLRRIGSAATDLAYTACGRFDAYFEYNLKPWDIAAGIIIVKQAGGDVINFKGGINVIDAYEIVATNGHITDEIMTIIKTKFK